MSTPPPGPQDDEILAVAGRLARGVSAELARPLRELRELLAGLVDALDHHVATAKGPTPLPWGRVSELRDAIAEAYLISRTIARLTDDMVGALTPSMTVSAAIDVNKTVHAALNLARHCVAEDTEVFMDFGALPSVRSQASALLVSIAWLITLAADAARGVEGSAISLATRRDTRPDEGIDDVVVMVADNGHGADTVERTQAILRRMLAGAGVTVAAQSKPETGTTFELRVPV
jgi:C4-dicarboxylate-specific signal transduction histidine kinase